MTREVPAMTNGGCLPSVSRGKKWRLCVRKFCPPEVTQSKIFKKKIEIVKRSQNY